MCLGVGEAESTCVCDGYGLKLNIQKQNLSLPEEEGLFTSSLNPMDLSSARPGYPGCAVGTARDP